MIIMGNRSFFVLSAFLMISAGVCVKIEKSALSSEKIEKIVETLLLSSKSWEKIYKELGIKKEDWNNKEYPRHNLENVESIRLSSRQKRFKVTFYGVSRIRIEDIVKYFGHAFESPASTDGGENSIIWRLENKKNSCRVISNFPIGKVHQSDFIKDLLIECEYGVLE